MCILDSTILVALQTTVMLQIIRRSGPEEKVLCIVRPRPGHYCSTAVMLISCVIWEGVPQSQADELYDYVRYAVPKYGFETERRCGTNDP